jgi:CRP-like cAMP-binding protein
MDGSSPLVTKLSRFVSLSDEDVGVLDALCVNEERFETDTDIVLQGDVPRSAFVLTHGIACCYRLLPDGKRQILTFMIPGDVFGLHAFLLGAMDHSIGTLVPTRLAAISRRAVFDLFEHHPRIGASLWWSALQHEAIYRERIVALGRRSARGRDAYMLCALVWQRSVGLAEDHAIRLPLTQVELADTLACTSTASCSVSGGTTSSRWRVTDLLCSREEEIDQCIRFQHERRRDLRQKGSKVK